MGRLVEFKFGELPKLLLVGKELRHSMDGLMQGNNPIPDFWDRCFTEGIFPALEQQNEFVYDPSYVGVMTDWDKGDGEVSYTVGMLMKPGAAVPEGLTSRTIDAAEVAIGWIQGRDTPDVCSNAHQLTEQALKSAGRGNTGMKWCIELYNCPRYTTPDQNGEIILDYYIPLDSNA